MLNKMTILNKMTMLNKVTICRYSQYFEYAGPLVIFDSSSRVKQGSPLGAVALDQLQLLAPFRFSSGSGRVISCLLSFR